jgi:hypothetical protein
MLRRNKVEYSRTISFYQRDGQITTILEHDLLNFGI